MADDTAQYISGLFGGAGSAADAAGSAAADTGGLAGSAALNAVGNAGSAIGGSVASSIAPLAGSAGAAMGGAAAGYNDFPGALASLASAFAPSSSSGGYSPITVAPYAGTSSAPPPTSVGGSTGTAPTGAGATPAASTPPPSVSTSDAQLGDFSQSAPSTAAPSSVGGTSASNVGGATAAPKTGMDAIAAAFKDPSLGNIVRALGMNAGPLVGAGGLVAAALRGNQPMPGESALRSTAAELGSQGQTLQGYLTSGTLPPGVAASLHQASEAAKATIRSQYASRGMTGSDAEARDLANVDNTMISQGANIATNLLSQGIQESGLSSQIYSNLMNAATQQDAALGQAISGFASSLVPQPKIVIGSGP